MIKYLGSKRLLISEITSAVQSLVPKGVFLDLFSGTSRVGIAVKNLGGYKVHANDYSHYAHTIAQCYIAADRESYEGKATALISSLNNLPPAESPGHFTVNYAQETRFFQEKNTLRIEAIRKEIEKVRHPLQRAIALTSLMEAADRVDSTCGIQMAYLKKWAHRSNLDLRLRVPELTEGKGSATRMTALDCLATSKATITYLDPPYNQHSYLGNYHIWETLVLWDEPDVYGKARKRVDTKTRKSKWNSKVAVHAEMVETLRSVTSPYVLLSFNNKGYLSKSEIEEALDKDFNVQVREISHPAYIGHKIGIHNLQGEKVGEPGSPTVSEYLFLGERK